jgi:hypothetical protein
MQRISRARKCGRLFRTRSLNEHQEARGTMIAPFPLSAVTAEGDGPDHDHWRAVQSQRAARRPCAGTSRTRCTQVARHCMGGLRAAPPISRTVPQRAGLPRHGELPFKVPLGLSRSLSGI